MNYRLSALALGATLLVGCASSSSGDLPQGRSDPLEGFNRTMFNFNFNVVDPYVLRPVAVAWRDYVPQPARNGLSNFTSNLEEPAVMVNYFLQGDPYKGMVHFTRFFLNTILGMVMNKTIISRYFLSCSTNWVLNGAKDWFISHTVW